MNDKLTNVELENRVLGMMLHGTKVTSLTGDEFTDEARKVIYLLLKKGDKSAINHQHYWIGDLRKTEEIPREQMRTSIVELKRLYIARVAEAELERVVRRLHKMSLEDLELLWEALPE